MPSKAGEVFLCAVCGDPHPDEEATLDDQLGPVCPCCKVQIKSALAWLAKVKIDRPINELDINPTNIKRFQNET